MRSAEYRDLKAPMRMIALAIMSVAVLAASSAQAWGDLGHQVTALIAYRHLTPAARATLDALLASDGDLLTAPDFASRSTWADRYRTLHRETAAWHFIDIEIDHADLSAACFDFPALGMAQLASAGPAQDCIVDKIDEFASELGNPATDAAERLLALKFLIHFVGDLHQPLHVADHQDRGGNCIALTPSPEAVEPNLHAFWDVNVVNALGTTAQAIADKLDAQIGAAQIKEWSSGVTRTWALETFAVGKHDAYALAVMPTCKTPGAVLLSPRYRAQADQDAALQLQRAAIRLAAMLNASLH